MELTPNRVTLTAKEEIYWNSKFPLPKTVSPVVEEAISEPVITLDETPVKDLKSFQAIACLNGLSKERNVQLDAWFEGVGKDRFLSIVNQIAQSGNKDIFRAAVPLINKHKLSYEEIETVSFNTLQSSTDCQQYETLLKYIELSIQKKFLKVISPFRENFESLGKTTTHTLQSFQEKFLDATRNSSPRELSTFKTRLTEWEKAYVDQKGKGYDPSNDSQMGYAKKIITLINQMLALITCVDSSEPMQQYQQRDLHAQSIQKGIEFEQEDFETRLRHGQIKGDIAESYLKELYGDQRYISMVAQCRKFGITVTTENTQTTAEQAKKDQEQYKMM